MSTQNIPTDQPFQFITVNNGNGIIDAAGRRLAKSHAVKRTIQGKVKLLQHDFYVVTPQQVEKATIRNRRMRITRSSPVINPTSVISPATLDPFNSLAADGNKLQEYLAHPTSRQAGEPIFSINDSMAFQTFGTIFQMSFEDPALLNALMLMFAVTLNGKTDLECMIYKSKAIEHLNNKMRKPLDAATEVTIRTILLLVAVESRLGLRSQVQIHMNGLSEIMKICEASNTPISATLKRSLFWQDLNSAWITGSKRIFSHDTFHELSWERQSCMLYKLPSGFLECSDIFTDKLITIIEDIQSFQTSRDSHSFCSSDLISIYHIDNQQASIESRLHNLREQLDETDYVVDCCIIAAYLCIYVMYTSIWEGHIIPFHCSSQLLRNLQKSRFDSRWNGKEALLTWIIYLGGSFAPLGVIRSEYAVLITGTYAKPVESFSKTWNTLEKCLKRFLWSNAFSSRCRELWEETA